MVGGEVVSPSHFPGSIWQIWMQKKAGQPERGEESYGGVGSQNDTFLTHNKITKLKMIKYAVPEGNPPMPGMSYVAILNNSAKFTTHF